MSVLKSWRKIIFKNWTCLKLRCVNIFYLSIFLICYNIIQVHLQVAELKKKQDAQAQLLRQKQKSDEAARRLQEEIQRIKSQKVIVS